MTELEHAWDGADDEDRPQMSSSEHDGEQPQPFLTLAHDLAGEHGRLVELAESCRAYAEQLSVREAELAERERWVSDAHENFSRQVRELSQREEEIDARAARAEEIDRRLSESQERESALLALGTELVERFGPTS